MPRQPDELETEPGQLCLDCPQCGQPVLYPGKAGDGADTMAECNRCDIYFCFDPDEAYVLPRSCEIDFGTSRNT